MNQEEMDNFHKYRFAPFYEQLQKSLIECVSRAEKYFVGLLQSVMTLSAALIAFVATAREIIL